MDEVFNAASTAGTVVPNLFMAIKYATGTEGGTSVTVTHASAVSMWQILAFSGVDQTTAQDVAAGTVDRTAGGGTVTILASRSPPPAQP